MDATTDRTATPAQIDGAIASLNTLAARAEQDLEAANSTIDRIDAAANYERDLPWNSPERRQQAMDAASAARVTIANTNRALAPLHEEYRDRGGWTRYYLVTNAGGHVHDSTSCSTCWPTTQYAWLTDYSGMTREALVDEARTLASTTCFPDAPVETRDQPTRIRYEAAEVRARREAREAKAAEKAAAAVTVTGYTEYGSRGPRTKTFKTARAVTNAIASDLTSLCVYGTGHPNAAQWVANIEAARAALQAKGVEYDYDKALAAARKKVVREGMTKAAY